MPALNLVSDGAIRAIAFACVIVAMMLWEIYLPRRQHAADRRQRWPTNFGAGIVNSALISTLTLFASIEVAILVNVNDWALIPLALIPLFGSNEALVIVFFVVAFDFTIYWQHRLFHLIKPIWRLHRAHHIDSVVDVSTSIRFHPLSFLLSFGVKTVLIVVLGPPVVAVLIADILLNVTSMFNHSNIYIPETWDRRLRWVLVTPDMHRIHHSRLPSETNSNFGFNFTIWDRLFGSYLDSPEVSQPELVVGITGFEAERSRSYRSLIVDPFTER